MKLLITFYLYLNSSKVTIKEVRHASDICLSCFLAFVPSVSRSFSLCVCVCLSHTHTRTNSRHTHPSVFFSSLPVLSLMFFFSLVKSAQAQLNLINLWVVQVSDHFPSQIWTSLVTLQSIKPNYPHYKDHQIPLSNPFSFPRQHRLSLMQTAHVWVGSDVILIWIPKLGIRRPNGPPM